MYYTVNKKIVNKRFVLRCSDALKMASEPSNIQENTENSVEFGESINADSAPNAAIACEFYYNLFLSGVSCDIVLESGVDQKR